MTAPARFTQADVTRVMKGAKVAGFTSLRVIIDPTGSIILEASDAPAISERRNPLDRILRGAG